MNTYGRSNTYQEVAVQTSSPAKLVVMLYEGGIRFLRQSVEAIQVKDLEKKRQSIDRVVAIIQHLQNTLDREKGGAIAADLDKLYAYVLSRVLEGSAKLQVAPLEEVIKLLSTLLLGWEEVVRNENGQKAVPTELLAQASERRLTVHA
jgi:flagellar protein FliS